MKKIFSKKILSAFLAAVMVLAMIPVGMIGAVAEAVSGTDYKVEGTTVTIYTVAGWNYVAENASTYASYDVALGADLDFDDGKDGVDDTTDDKPLFGEGVVFSGSFDGNGKKISNFAVGNGTRSDIAAIIAAETSAEKEISIVNVIIDNAKIKTADKYFGVVVGKLGYGGTFENISVNAIADNYLNDRMGCSGLVGYHSAATYMTVDKCNITGSITAAGNTNVYAGGIVGWTEDATGTASQETKVSNCYIDATIKAGKKIGTANSGTSERVGAIVGRWSHNNKFNKLIVDSCYLAGEYATMKSDRTGVIGGAIRSDADISNVVITATISNTTTTGYLCSFGNNNYTYNLSNIYTASTLAEGTSLIQNGAKCNGTITDGVATDKITGLVSFDNDGFIVGVAGSLADAKYAQSTGNADLNTGDTYIIRFVAPILKDIDADSATMTIVVKNGDTVVKTFTKSDCTMFEELTGHNKGITETYKAGEGAYTDVKAFAAVAIMDVPVGTAYSYEVSLDFSVGGVEIEGATFVATASAVGVLS